jgi:hypothetical protein
VSGDLNHDANPDLVVSSTGGNGAVTVLLGNGTGGFGSPTPYASGVFSPYEIRLADVNADTNLDLVTANLGADSISVLLGNGTGGFGTGTAYPAGDDPASLTLGDFNHDNNLDVAVANTGVTSGVSVLLGNGTGGYGAPTTFSGGNSPRAVATGEFNGDGHLDLVVTNFGSNTVSVLLGNGTGSFGAPTSFPAQGAGLSIVVADFNRDGRDDVAVIGSTSAGVVVMFGNGTGGFGSPANFPAGSSPFDLTVGDFNVDGALDIAAVNAGSDNVSVLRNNCVPAGTTGTPTSVSTVAATASRTPTTVGTAVTTSTATRSATSVATGTIVATGTATQAATGTSIAATSTSTQVSTGTPVGATSTSVAATATTVAGTPTPCTVSFVDVPANNTFYANIRCLACNGILGGYSDGTFRPNNDITRGQIAKVVSNAAGFNENPGAQIYEDVPSTNPFYAWINRLSMRGHMGGYLCGTVPTEPCGTSNRPYFRPNANATRGQLAKIVASAAHIIGTPTGQRYEDVAPDSTFYVWIEQLSSLGVMGGYACGRPSEPCGTDNKPYFRPNNNVTRGQASKIVANTFFPSCNP